MAKPKYEIGDKVKTPDKISVTLTAFWETMKEGKLAFRYKGRDKNGNAVHWEEYQTPEVTVKDFSGKKDA